MHNKHRGEESSSKGIENIFLKTITENLPQLGKEKPVQMQDTRDTK